MVKSSKLKCFFAVLAGLIAITCFIVPHVLFAKSVYADSTVTLDTTSQAQFQTKNPSLTQSAFSAVALTDRSSNYMNASFINFGSYADTANKYSVGFKGFEYDMKNVSQVAFEIYFSSAYYPTNGSYEFYASDSTGTVGVQFTNSDITALETRLDLVVGGADLAKITNARGTFDGFQFILIQEGGTDVLFYVTNIKFTYSTGYTLTYNGEDFTYNVYLASGATTIKDFGVAYEWSDASNTYVAGDSISVTANTALTGALVNPVNNYVIDCSQNSVFSSETPVLAGSAVYDDATLSVNWGLTLANQSVSLGSGAFISFNIGGWNASAYKVGFRNFEIDMSEVSQVTFEIYYGAASLPTIGSYEFYASDSNGATCVQFDTSDVTATETRINWVVDGADLEKITNARGTFDGFQFVLLNVSGPNVIFYVTKITFTYNEGYTLTYNGEDFTYNVYLASGATTVKDFSVAYDWFDESNSYKAGDAVSVTANTVLTKYDVADGIKYSSLSLNGDIGVNFYVHVGGTANLTANGGTLSSVKATVDGIVLFKFTINVAAKDYKNNIEISIDGTAIEATYKVETYIDAITNENPAYNLVQSLKTYCEAARAFFADETPDAAAAVDIDAGYSSSVSGDDDGIELVGATLILETKTAIKVYFKAADIDGKTFTVNGVAVVPAAVDGYDDLYMITIDNIAAVDLNTTYTIVVGGYTISYSALSYAYAVVNNGGSGVAIANVAKALYNYNVQADAYATL